MEDSAEVKPTTPEQQAQQQEAAPVDTAAAPSTTDASQPPVDQTAASQPVQSEGEVVATTNGEATISSDAAATPAAPQDAPIADATTTGDATAAATAVAQGEATNETREMSPTDPAAPNTAPEAVAAPAAGPLNFNFLTLKDLYTKPTVVLTEDADVTFAKSFLKAQTGAVGNNVYDHMTSIVMRILETRPGNPVGKEE